MTGMTVDKMIVISLDRTPERFARFVTLNPGLPVERFPAFDGRTLDRSLCVSEGLITESNPYRPGGLGSLASHVALWRRCVAEGLPVHIAEDDALFRHDFVSAASAALDALDDWDFVLWTWNFDWPMKLRLAPGMGSAVLHSNQVELGGEWKTFFDVTTAPVMARLISAAGSCCYSLSPRGAEQLIEWALPVAGLPAIYAARPNTAWANGTVDVELSRHYESLNAYVALPCLALSLNVQAESTILNS